MSYEIVYRWIGNSGNVEISTLPEHEDCYWLNINDNKVVLDYLKKNDLIEISEMLIYISGLK